MPAINANADAIKLFTTKLRKTEPAAAKNLQAQLRVSANSVRDEARSSYASWSSSIPSRVRSRVTGNTATVTVSGLGGLYAADRNWRHPVFASDTRANANVAWVYQGVKNNGDTSKPGPRNDLKKIGDARQSQVKSEMAEAIMGAIEDVLET